ncbi:MAG: hypothetical protein KJ905_00470 [Nanoarchaeota archaeon]|nr:hypothetical protein [Nanoarchaeota archaeon]MBU1501234.1 hypothetical protein [Nanoarchaeota archaeon]
MENKGSSLLIAVLVILIISLISTSSATSNEFQNLNGAEVISRIHGVGKSLEKSLGASQDVEWAIKGDDLYLLQTRPTNFLIFENNFYF